MHLWLGETMKNHQKNCYFPWVEALERRNLLSSSVFSAALTPPETDNDFSEVHHDHSEGHGTDHTHEQGPPATHLNYWGKWDNDNDHGRGFWQHQQNQMQDPSNPPSDGGTTPSSNVSFPASITIVEVVIVIKFDPTPIGSVSGSSSASNSVTQGRQLTSSIAASGSDDVASASVLDSQGGVSAAAKNVVSIATRDASAATLVSLVDTSSPRPGGSEGSSLQPQRISVADTSKLPGVATGVSSEQLTEPGATPLIQLAQGGEVNMPGRNPPTTPLLFGSTRGAENTPENSVVNFLWAGLTNDSTHLSTAALDNALS